MNAMRPTGVRLLLAVAAVSAAVGWGAVRVVDSWLGRIVPVPWLAAAAMWLLASALLYWAVTTRARLRHAPGTKPMPPILAARTAALAMAASRAGALVAGAYVGIAIAMVPVIGTPTGAATFWSASLTALGAVAMIITALWLEHLCRLPIGPPDDYPDRV